MRSDGLKATSERAQGWLRRLARDLERRVTHRWTRRLPRPIDRALVRVSQAADHSVLWLVLASVGAIFGGRRGKRAAKYGVLALALTSGMVNGPIKLLFDRRRPTARRRLRRMPRTSSFPSGHAASAFAFSVAASRELPEAAPLLLPLAATVAYSRVYLGVHYPSDVVAGGAVGTAMGMAARRTARKLGLARSPEAQSHPRIAREAVLVVSPHAGNSRGLARARRELDRRAIQVTEELDVEHVDRLPELLRNTDGESPLVIAAGGDGTVGSVAGYLAGTDSVLGILPLGTGNDFARSLDIPIDPEDSAELIATGQPSNVDLGRLTRDGQPPAHFVHAATVGLNVDFSRFATRASLRARLGRLTYLAAAVYALREHSTFECVLRHDDASEEVSLVQLAVISAPVIGGSLGLNVRGPHPQGEMLDVLVIEDVPPLRMLRAGVFLLLGIGREVAGVRSLQLATLEVGSEHALGLTLDGELDGTLPGQFELLPGALRVITPRQE